MKIIHVENYFDPKAGYQINELLYANKNFGDEVFLITSKDMSRFHKLCNEDDDREFENKANVKIIRLDSYLKVSSRIVLKNLNKVIRDINPDLVFMHGIGDFRDLYLWKTKRRYKIVRDCHMSWVASKNKFNRLYFLLYKIFFTPFINKTSKYEKVYALGVEEHQYLNELGVQDKKIEYLLHGYNKKIMYFDQNERAEVRKKYNFDDEDIVISYIGKFNRYKEPDLIFEVMKLLGNEFLKSYKIKLLLIGSKDKAYMQEFNNKLESIKTCCSVVIDEAKPFNELRKYYSASDICIFPKQTSLSAIHAQVCGCPVVMERHVSNEERVFNKENLYEIDDLNQAAHIIKRIIERKEYYKTDENFIRFEEREYENQIRKLRSVVLELK